MMSKESAKSTSAHIATTIPGADFQQQMALYRRCIQDLGHDPDDEFFHIEGSDHWITQEELAR